MRCNNPIYASGYLKRSVFLLFIALLTITTEAQQFDHRITSEAFGEDRTIKVFLPERYQRDSIERYIVTYVLDAQDDQFWNMAKGNIDYMVSRYTVIPMIVVGIVSEDRSDEFDPQSTQLHTHLRNEVFPLVEANYRTKPFRVIVGHSWGGAFVGNTLFSDNSDMFDAYIGISPSFDAMNNVIFHAADSLLSANINLPKYLYHSWGDVGFEKEYIYTGQRMDSLLSMHPENSLHSESSYFRGKDHFSGVIPALNEGLTLMSRNYFADQKIIEDMAAQSDHPLMNQIEDFYTAQEGKYGYVHRPKLGYYKFVANELRDYQNVQAAIQLYEFLVDQDPDDVKTQVNLADAYIQMQYTGLAQLALKRAQELLEEQKDDLSPGYYKSVSDWVKENLDK